jgi:RNA polymerase sigma-70 factor (ECF subfamily)
MVSLDLIDEISLHRRASRDDPRWSDVEACVVDQLSERSILTVIESLPHQFRDVVLLADVEGATYESIARKLDMPLGSVASRLFRARRRLQVTLRAQAVAVERLERAS